MDTRSITADAADDVAFVREKLQASIEEEELLTIRRWLYPDGKYTFNFSKHCFTL